MSHENDLVRTVHLSGRVETDDQPGIPQSEEIEIVEHFTPTDDGSRRNYVLTITDTKVFTEPQTQVKYWLYLPDQEVLPFDCTARD